MGRKPKPAQIITMEGNTARKTKSEIMYRDENEQAMAVNQPDKFIAPEDLQGKSRDIFYETKSMLKKMNLLHNADVRLVATYSKEAALADELWLEIDKAGLTYLNEKGELKNNPTIMEWRRTTQQLVKLSAELGFTPTSRAALAYKQAEESKNKAEEDEFAN